MFGSRIDLQGSCQTEDGSSANGLAKGVFHTKYGAHRAE
jgi:hypothetical protein